MIRVESPKLLYSLIAGTIIYLLIVWFGARQDAASINVVQGYYYNVEEDGEVIAYPINQYRIVKITTQVDAATINRD